MDQLRWRRHSRPSVSILELPKERINSVLRKWTSLLYGFCQNSLSDIVLVFSLVLLLLTLWRCWLDGQHVRFIELPPSISVNPTCGETFDVVYTWVNGTDPEFQAAVKFFSNSTKDRRYRDHDELRYSMRSLEKYAPWVGQVYLVTNGQVPHWLNREKVKVVTHQEIFKDKSNLPTFASPSIETSLCNIPGLSRRFLYFNDDIFLGAPVYPEDFISPHGIQRIYLSWEVPDCAPQCSEAFIGDNYCDVACNVSSCDWDGGDCAAKRTKKPLREPGSSDDYASHGSLSSSDFKDVEETKSPEFDLDTCAHSCAVAWIGDGICDASCRNKFCGFDAGDCLKDSKSQLPIFNFVVGSTRNHVEISRPTRDNPIWYSFLIDVKDIARKGKIVDVVHNRPQYVRAFVYVHKWNAILVVASMSALDRLTRSNSSTTAIQGTENIVNCRIQYEYRAPANASTTSSRKPGLSSSSATGEGNKTKDVINTPGRMSIEAVNFTFSIVPGTLQNETKSETPKERSEFDDFPDVLDDDVDEYASHVLNIKDEDSYTRLDSYLQMEQATRKGGRSSKAETWEGEESGEEAPPGPPDFFALSLVYTRSQLKKFFKKKVELNTKVPAHMPHLIDKERFARLYHALSPAFEKTASHKFRQEEDIQFGYAYFTFLMAESEMPLPDDLVWSFVDSNGDGCINANEFRTLVSFILSEDALYATKPPSPASDSDEEREGDLESFLEINPRIDSALLLRAHDNIWAEARASSMVPLLDSCLSHYVLKRATRAFEALERAVRKTWSRSRPTYEIVDSVPYVTFAMLRDKASDVLKTLDELRARPTKFVCINDDTTPAQEPKAAAASDKALRNFLESWFPKPSIYEVRKEEPKLKVQVEVQKSSSWAWNNGILLLNLLFVTAAVIYALITGCFKTLLPKTKPHGL